MADITLCVGDAHVEPGQNLRRFSALGRLTRDVSPDRIVLMGDFGSFDSLSAWDRDKRRKMEGRRYIRDCESVRTALTLMESSAGKKMWTGTHRIFLEGNHEDRVTRYLNTDPTFEGSVGVHKDCFADWQWVPFKSEFRHNGVSFTHIPHNEAGKAIGGKDVCSKALGIYHNSVVFGHTHQLAVGCVHRHNAPHLNQAVNVGCFFEHVAEYAQGSVTSYWRGVVVLKHTSWNRVDVETISMSRLKSEYKV